MVRFIDDGGADADEHLAPVTPLFGRASDAVPPAPARDGGGADRSTRDVAAGWDRTWTSDPAVDGGRARTKSGLSRERAAPAGPPESADQARAAAEKELLRKLRGKPLSISEARTVLGAHDDLDEKAAAAIIDAACRRGYLDDAALAEHLIHLAVDRKGQGRTAIALALQKRRIPRDVIDAALQELPDDDAERAMEFARTKARQLDRVESDVALRRLVGQLSRRGYNGSIAMDAARRALAEHRSGGVRFS
ncbi:regulatory protein RecX [Microbacterium aquimaris]|uniref:Regulatory protein RecX n=1 Tax=Microbacterium aquimaris TaxID=459816 RepID=A0ABU5N6P6_9MICO|nr:regulatory protein RecX [Microbacterium aquimaris]MDZ8161735.1 regulatory protein RecX [Microbacterium aquimaris]